MADPCREKPHEPREASGLCLPAVPRPTRACQACGKGMENLRRKYCSKECREKLLAKLDVATNLLRAINTRYATFSFNDSSLVLNVVVWGSREVFCFFWDRSTGARPANDLGRLTEALGREWWKVRNQNKSRYQASWHVLGLARTSASSHRHLRPVSIYSPRVAPKHLTVLKLSEEDLVSPDAGAAIKTAYRRQVNIHHPDHGGQAAKFRKVQEAHKELMAWL
ncbi:MAG: J domain-containing protein, partial [Proteobacteria bacterium]|nr:J domain-containing protein [Pseudomonadota bacterium]